MALRRCDDKSDYLCANSVDNDDGCNNSEVLSSDDEFAVYSNICDQKTAESSIKHMNSLKSSFAKKETSKKVTKPNKKVKFAKLVTVAYF